MELLELLKTRRSYRRFNQSRPIPDKVLTEILQAQQYASCSRNIQSLRYIAVRTPELVEQIFPLVGWAGALPDSTGRPQDGDHPTMFIVVLDDKNVQNPRTAVNVGLAVSNMTLAAWNHGVGSCIIGNVARAPLRTLLNLDDRFSIFAVIAFGYPTHTSTIQEVTDGESLVYYLDEQNNFVVPRKKVSDIVKIL